MTKTLHPGAQCLLRSLQRVIRQHRIVREAGNKCFHAIVPLNQCLEPTVWGKQEGPQPNATRFH